MEPAITVSKLSTQVVDTRPAQYEVKVPYEVQDAYGNKATLYRKEIETKENLEGQKANLQKEIDKIDERLAQIATLK